MRLFLDAHLSAKRVGLPLSKQGHDVRAADAERALDKWTDERLLALAASEGRIMVTFDAAHFPRMLRTWAEMRRSHAGCIVLLGIDHSEFGHILKLLDTAFSRRPDQQDWRDCTALLGRAA